MIGPPSTISTRSLSQPPQLSLAPLRFASSGLDEGPKLLASSSLKSSEGELRAL